MNFNRKSILAAAVAMALSSGAYADLISFDTNGGAAGGLLTSVATFDWAPGSAVAVGTVPLTSVGQTFKLLYQANLSVLQDGASATLFTNGGGGSFFTAVAGFTEVVTSIGGTTANFGLAAGGGGFFKICAQSAQGNNLAGTGFACTTPILSGHLTSVNSSNFSTTPSTTTVNLDQSPNGDQWAGQQSVTGSGASDITVRIDSVDALYFPSFDLIKSLVFSFFNTSQVVPFKQVDPSKHMSTDGSLDGDHVVDPGLVNGLFAGAAGKDFIFQADANQSFVVSRIPEPGTVALLGMALGVAGLVARRRRK